MDAYVSTNLDPEGCHALALYRMARDVVSTQEMDISLTNATGRLDIVLNYEPRADYVEVHIPLDATATQRVSVRRLIHFCKDRIKEGKLTDGRQQAPSFYIAPRRN